MVKRAALFPFVFSPHQSLLPQWRPPAIVLVLQTRFLFVLGKGEELLGGYKHAFHHLIGHPVTRHVEKPVLHADISYR